MIPKVVLLAATQWEWAGEVINYFLVWLTNIFMNWWNILNAGFFLKIIHISHKLGYKLFFFFTKSWKVQPSSGNTYFFVHSINYSHF